MKVHHYLSDYVCSVRNCPTNQVFDDHSGLLRVEYQGVFQFSCYLREVSEKLVKDNRSFFTRYLCTTVQLA